MTNLSANNAVALETKDGLLSQVASLAKRLSWDVREAKKQLPERYHPHIRATMDEWARSLRALKTREPLLNGSETRQVKQAFLPLAAKMRPDMSEDKASVWTNSVVAALSDLPPRIIIKACALAMHQVFEFPTALEQYLRTRAETLRADEWDAISRLRALHDAIYGKQQPLQLEQAEDAPMTKAEVAEVVAIADPELRQHLIGMGLGCGAIDPDLLAEVQAQ